MIITDKSRSYDRRATSRHPGGTNASGCECSTCARLHTFVRPRFFAGQTLTETELTALTSYAIEKDRLHNRYLHGTGVVCGLQVECDACGPGVVVRPGYAIDPLGADVVLPNGESVNVVDLIAACQRPKRTADCDPPRPPPAMGCEEREQSWCLWIRYVEKQGRLVAPLGGHATCSCATPPDDCGCTGSPGGRSSCTCQEAPRTASRRSADCEPSRISELYEFGVARREGGSCDEELTDRVSGTFPLKVVECIKTLKPILSSGMTKSMQASALSLAVGAKPAHGDASRNAICTLYSNIVELFRRDPLHTQCVLPQELLAIDCSPRDEKNETVEQYQQRLLAALEAMLQLVLIYLRDCLCFSLLPPCPPDTCDDRVMLACVTVRDGRVLRICNLACRRHAGSFVNREYWMPIGPTLSWLAALACCFPLPTRRLVNVPDDRNLTATAQPATQPSTQAATQPSDQPYMQAQPSTTTYTGIPAQGYSRTESGSYVGDFLTSGPIASVLTAVRADNFALPFLWRARARSTLKRWGPLERLVRAEAAFSTVKGTVALAPLLHSDVAVARATLRKKGVKVEVVEVADRAEALGHDLVPRAAKGETATLYTLHGTVVGVSGARTPLGDQGAGS